MSFICRRIKNHFHVNGFAFSLALKQRLWATRKWPNVLEKLHRTSPHSLRAAVIEPLLQALPPCYPKYFAGDMRRMFPSIYLWGAPALILSLSHYRLLAIVIWWAAADARSCLERPVSLSSWSITVVAWSPLEYAPIWAKIFKTQYMLTTESEKNNFLKDGPCKISLRFLRQKNGRY